MTKTSRRNFLKTSVLGSASVVGSSGLIIESAQAQSKPS